MSTAKCCECNLTGTGQTRTYFEAACSCGVLLHRANGNLCGKCFIGDQLSLACLNKNAAAALKNPQVVEIQFRCVDVGSDRDGPMQCRKYVQWDIHIMRNQVE